MLDIMWPTNLLQVSYVSFMLICTFIFEKVHILYVILIFQMSEMMTLLLCFL